MAKVLELNFQDAVGRNAKISVSTPREDLTDAEVKTAMESMIAANALQSRNGAFTGINSAKIVDTQVTEFVVE